MKSPPADRLAFEAERGFRMPAVPGSALPRRTFVSTYYDTSDHRLARADVMVRRRVERRKSVWQVSFLRGRVRLELPGRRTPDPAETLRMLLPVYTRGAELAPLATLATRRSSLIVTDHFEPVAEIVLDTIGVVEDQHVARQLRHVEVRPLGGDEEALSRIGMLLEEAGAKRTDGRSPLFQALGLEYPAIVEPAVESASAADHILAMLRAQLASMRAHDPGTRLGADPEELHQMRTAVRRLRAILRTARSMFDASVEELRSELDWLGTALGVVRDLDVLRESLSTEIALFDAGERAAGRRLLRRLDAERTRGRTALLTALNDPRYFALVDALDERLQHSPQGATDLSLPDMAAAAFKRLRKAVDRLAEEPSDEDLHDVRIKLKRARYTAELAQAGVGRLARRFVDTARKVQDVLGEHQDAVVAEERLRILLEGAGGRGAAFAAGRLVERQRGRRRAARSAFVDRWPKLERRGRKAWGDV